MIIGVLRWGWVEVILRVSLEVILRKLLRHNRVSVSPQNSLQTLSRRYNSANLAPLPQVLLWDAP